MIDLSRNHFELFGLPRAFRIDAEALDRAFRGLQAEVHPDRFAAAPDADRRLALQGSARVNEAYRMLKDPVERARYLLSLRGIDAFDERDTALPRDFLEAQLERREGAADAADAENIGALERILAGIRAEIDRRQQALGELLDDPRRADEAKSRVRELRFLAKVAEDVNAMLGALDA